MRDWTLLNLPRISCKIMKDAQTKTMYSNLFIVLLNSEFGNLILSLNKYSLLKMFRHLKMRDKMHLNYNLSMYWPYYFLVPPPPNHFNPLYKLPSELPHPSQQAPSQSAR